MPKISVITPTFNEQDNVADIYNSVKNVMSELGYDYEHIFIDNKSHDETVRYIKLLAIKDKHVKLICNTRNFGHIRSPYYGLLQSTGDASIILAADGQDPPELIKEFIDKWESGYNIVVGVKKKSGEGFVKHYLRTLCYKVLSKLSDKPLVENFMGFGLFDKRVVDILRDMNDSYPFLRGMISDIGYDICEIEYEQPKRKNGKSHNNLYVLLDIALLGLTNNSKVPLRVATIGGVVISLVSFMVAGFYLVYKIINWDNFTVGLAPLVIGMGFLGGVQLMFLGLIGEYVGAVYTQVMNRPLVIEKERINFD